MSRQTFVHLNKFSRADSHLSTVFCNHGTISKEDDLTQNWVVNYLVVDCHCLKESNNQKCFIPQFLLQQSILLCQVLTSMILMASGFAVTM